jgi:hypothetical protein
MTIDYNLIENFQKKKDADGDSKRRLTRELLAGIHRIIFIS